MAKNKKGKGKGDEKPAPPPKSPPAPTPVSPPPAINIQSEIHHPSSPEPQVQTWGTTAHAGGAWGANEQTSWGGNVDVHHGGDNGSQWAATGQDAHQTAHTWGEPANSLLQPPPNQQQHSHLETIPEQYTGSDLSGRTYSGTFEDDDRLSSRGGGSHYDRPYTPHADMTAAPDHSAMRSPALTGRPALDEAAPPVIKDPIMQTQKTSSASEAARKLEESRRGANPPQPSNVASPADHHTALRAHQHAVGGHTPMSSASAAAALYEASVNRNKAQKPAPKPAPKPVDPPLPGKTTWTYPKLVNGKRAGPIAPDPSWILTGGNAWSNKHRATKSTSATGAGAPWPPQPHPQQDMGGWHQGNPRNSHQAIPASQFHGVHSPQHQKHQSYPGHSMQQQYPGVQHNEAERWQNWDKSRQRAAGGGQAHHGAQEHTQWDQGGATWDEEEEDYGQWDSQWDHKAGSAAGGGGGGWDDDAWGAGQGHGHGHGQAKGHGQGRGHGQAPQNPQQAHAEALAQHMKAQMQHMYGQGGRGQSKEKVNEAAGAWGAGGGGAGWGAQTQGAGWGGEKAGSGWGDAKAEGWGGAKAAEAWGGAKAAEGWGSAKGEGWGQNAGGWNSPMHQGASADWSQHKAPSHSGKDAAGSRNAVSDQQRSQIYNMFVANTALNQGQAKNASNLTTKQHQQQAAMMAHMAAAAAAAGGGNVKVQQKTKMQYSTKPGVWEAFDQEAWGEMGSSDEEYGNRKVHFSPKESEVWGASPRSIPSKTLAAAAAKSGIATTPLNLSSNVRFVESKGAAFSFVSEAFFGNTRLARERIHWLFPVEKDPRVAAMHQWVKKMSYNLGTFGLIKFLETRERGALFLNVVFRMEDFPKEPAFDWLTFPMVQGTMDKNIQESVAFYDPSEVVMVILYLPSQSGKSVAAWRVKVNVPDDARAKYQPYIVEVAKGLRAPKDYVIMLDEAPRTQPPKVPAKTALRKSKTIKGGKTVTVKSTTKVLPNGQIQQGKKKRKWWKFFLS